MMLYESFPAAPYFYYGDGVHVPEYLNALGVHTRPLLREAGFKEAAMLPYLNLHRSSLFDGERNYAAHQSGMTGRVVTLYAQKH
jgi:hypothetical protein